ncbi:MAG TPA: hypothetical protein VKZ60_00825 [Chloroflexota bacterium]|jgi:hypothetical protein|nr:hypothetical protein [Chloroflexota bacterium]
MRALGWSVVLALAAVAWLPTAAVAQSGGCRWIGEGEALLCAAPGDGPATLSAWQGGAWVTVPAPAGFTLPAALGGLSTYGRSQPPGPVPPLASAYSQSWQDHTLTQTAVVYGPGETSRSITCTTWYSGYAGGVVYQACR